MLVRALRFCEVSHFLDGSNPVVLVAAMARNFDKHKSVLVAEADAVSVEADWDAIKFDVRRYRVTCRALRGWARSPPCRCWSGPLGINQTQPAEAVFIGGSWVHLVLRHYGHGTRSPAVQYSGWKRRSSKPRLLKPGRPLRVQLYHVTVNHGEDPIFLFNDKDPKPDLVAATVMDTLIEEEARGFGFQPGDIRNVADA